MAGALTPERISERIAAGAAKLLRAKHAVVYRLDQKAGVLVLAASVGTAIVPKGARIPRGAGLASHAAKLRRAVVSRNILQDARFSLLPDVRDGLRRARLGSVIAAPLQIAKRIIGAIAVADRPRRAFTSEDLDLIQAFSDQAAAALEIAERYRQDREQKRREAEGLARVARYLIEPLSIEQVGQRTVESILPLTGSASAALRVLEADGSLRAVAFAGLAAEAFPVGHVLPPGGGIAGRAATEGRVVVATVKHLDADLPDDLQAYFKASGLRSVLAVPLSARGVIVGVLSISRFTEKPLPKDGLRLVQAFADQAALALDNARLHERQEASLRELRRKNEALEGLARTLSHEVRAPIGVLETTTRTIVAAYGPLFDDAGRRQLQRLHDGIQSIEEIVRDMLTLTEIERETASPSPVALTRLVEDIKAVFLPVLRKRGGDIRIESLPAVIGIRAQLQRIFYNLIDNALKYVPAGVNPVVEVGCMSGDPPHFYVSDNGIGIAPEHDAVVFEPFRRLNVLNVRGTGIGLAVVKKVVERHGGRVWIDSERGSGATVRFTWPAPGWPAAKAKD